MTKAAFRDHLGRPIVAVTGMGVITSLGQGLEDNWAALSGGGVKAKDGTRPHSMAAAAKTAILKPAFIRRSPRCLCP